MQHHPHLRVDRSHAFMLAGPIGAGKTTLFNILFDRPAGDAQKTQAVEYEADIGLDTPGEFFSHPRLYRALINTASDVGTLIYVQAADDFECRLPPGLLGIYRDKPLIGVITKIDVVGADPDRVEALMRAHGIGGEIFRVSAQQPISVLPLKRLLAGASGAWAPGFVHDEESLG
jgi:ethanolamine utilization protein EutP